MKYRLGLLFAMGLLTPVIASAELVTFDIAGGFDPVLRPSGVVSTFAATFTVDTDNAGTPLNYYESPGEYAASSASFNIVEPGTGLSVDIGTQTYFASSLTINLIVGVPSDPEQCPTAPHICDFIAVNSDIARFYLTSNYAGPGTGLDQATLAALATESLSGFYSNLVGEGAVLNPPDYPQILGGVNTITKVSEPDTDVLMLLGVLGLPLSLKRRPKPLTVSQQA